MTAWRATDPAQVFWHYLCRKGCVPVGLAMRVWPLLRPRPEVEAWRVALTTALQADVPACRPQPLPVSPRAVILTLEALVEARQLSRHVATSIEECFFTIITRHGRWK